MPFIYQNAIQIIKSLYGDDTDSQAQGIVPEEEAQRGRDLKRLVEEIAQSVSKLPEERRKYQTPRLEVRRDLTIEYMMPRIIPG